LEKVEEKGGKRINHQTSATPKRGTVAQKDFSTLV
jgi:hypothetical protein